MCRYSIVCLGNLQLATDAAQRRNQLSLNYNIMPTGPSTRRRRMHDERSSRHAFSLCLPADVLVRCESIS